MGDIVVEIESVDLETIKSQDGVTLVESNRFDGSTVVQVIVYLSAVSIPWLSKIIIEAIKSDRHVKVKKDGMVIEGINPDSISDLLNELDDD